MSRMGCALASVTVCRAESPRQERTRTFTRQTPHVVVVVARALAEELERFRRECVQEVTNGILSREPLGDLPQRAERDFQVLVRTTVCGDKERQRRKVKSP